MPFKDISYLGGHWLSGRVLDLRLRGCGLKLHRRHCIVSLSKNINPSLELVQPRENLPFITEQLLTVPKESNQTKHFLSIALAAPLCSGLEPFVQYWKKAS